MSDFSITSNGKIYCPFCMQELATEEDECTCHASQKARQKAKEKAYKKTLPKHDHDRPPRRLAK